jgi:hypothetical protein
MRKKERKKKRKEERKEGRKKGPPKVHQLQQTGVILLNY